MVYTFDSDKGKRHTPLRLPKQIFKYATLLDQPVH
jgi:hypothetical protein